MATSRAHSTFIDGALLSRVQPGEAYRIKLTETGFDRTQQDIPQFGKPVAFCTQDIFQCLEHRAVRSFVEIKLDSEIICGLYIHNSSGTGHNHYHACFVSITDGGCKIEVSDFTVGRLTEETDGASELKVMFYIEVLGMCNFYY